MKVKLKRDGPGHYRWAGDGRWQIVSFERNDWYAVMVGRPKHQRFKP